MKKLSLIIILLIISITFTSFLASQSKDEYREIVLKIVIGTVEKGISEDGDEIYWNRVRPGTILREGEYLKTSDNSNASLSIGEDLIKVEEGSTVELHYVKSGGTALSVISGTILTKVEKLTEGGSFNVNSPSAVAGVRGTSFRFSYDRKSGQSTVKVDEGIVEVGNTAIKNKSVMLDRNQRVSLEKAQDPTNAQIEDTTPEVRVKSSEDLVSKEEKVELDLFDKEIDVED